MDRNQEYNKERIRLFLIMFKTLGILRSLKDRVKVPTLDMVFERIDVDERRYDCAACVHIHRLD